MKKEISPDMYNYNKFPGPSFARVGDKVVAENIEFDLLENYKEAFDQTIFGQRFSQLMLKFDYIVGDWGNDQLRLKGFYKEDRPVKSDLKINRLDDYLLEYCNFGCAYFVLGNAQPQELPEEPEEGPRRKRKRNRNRHRQPVQEGAVTGSDNQHFSKKEKQKRREKRENTTAMRNFIVKQDKQSKKQKQERSRKRETNREMNEAKRGFVIRQK